MKTVRLGRAFHIRTNRRCMVDMVNQSNDDCFVYWDDGPPYGGHVRASELVNDGGVLSRATFREPVRADFMARNKLDSQGVVDG